MSTNYYLHSKLEPDNEPLHIGKSSVGWAFALHIHPERDINNLYVWAKWMRDKNFVILDEYDRTVSYDEMLKIIMDRKFRKRSDIDGEYCIGHGTGSFDYIIGDFS